MLKQNVTILLIGLMCLSTASGSFTVICRGSDGHIAAEPAFHDHCPPSEIFPAPDQDNSAAATCSSTDHDHCQDSLPTSNLIMPGQKKVRLSTPKDFAPNVILSSAPVPALSFFTSFLGQRRELSSFCEPLRTIIILT